MPTDMVPCERSGKLEYIVLMSYYGRDDYRKLINTEGIKNVFDEQRRESDEKTAYGSTLNNVAVKVLSTNAIPLRTVSV